MQNLHILKERQRFCIAYRFPLSWQLVWMHVLDPCKCEYACSWRTCKPALIEINLSCLCFSCSSLTALLSALSTVQQGSMETSLFPSKPVHSISADNACLQIIGTMPSYLRYPNSKTVKSSSPLWGQYENACSWLLQAPLQSHPPSPSIHALVVLSEGS